MRRDSGKGNGYPFCACAPDGEAGTNYPVCGQDGVELEKSIRSGMTLVPFNEKLNRLMLVVRNATASRHQVTRGDDSKSLRIERFAGLAAR